MTAQYWVGDFFVDLTRNQITQKTESQTIPPKALAVLTHLAKNVNKVVSHDELLTQVWPDTIVTPNSLQRSIAQLRKALGEDGHQSYIKTHSKQGYSLEVEVRWQDVAGLPRHNTFEENSIDQTRVSGVSGGSHKIANKESSRPKIILASLAAGMIILSVIGYLYFTSLTPNSHNKQLTFDKLRLLTATDDKEFDATYTPDGKYIVFHRYLDKQCGNKLWAKNIATQKETLLTQDWGAYGSHRFSKDGKRLVFFKTEACSEPMSQTDCYDLVSLDFDKALESPQQPSLILQCKNSVVKNPTWLNNNDIAFLQKETNRWKLISYSLSSNKSTDLYDLNDGNLIDYSYSVRDDLIAVVRIDNAGQYHIEMLNADGRILSSHPIERPQEIPKFRPIYPSFDPLNKQLIFSTGRQLFTLSYQGKVAHISLPFADKMAQPEFHPDGKRLLMIKGPYDSDIVLLPLSEIIESNLAGTAKSSPSFERSNLGENYAIFQPGGQLIAFWSERSGEQQLWISDGSGPRQLTNFPMDSYIHGIDWAKDGKSLLINANNVLTQVFLDSSQKHFPLKYPVIRLFQWDSENKSALLLARINGTLRFVEYDFTNSGLREVNDKTVIWALKSEDGRLIYKDNLDQFWQPGPAEAQRIKALDKLGGAKMFVIRGNVIYAVNSENQLWSYDLSDEVFKVLGEVGEDVDYLTDINETQLLMTVKVAAKKEVVELSVSE